LIVCGYHGVQTERNLPPMLNGFDSPAALWILIAIQCLGILSAFAARFSEGSPRQAISQGAFLGALPLMGAATLLALAVGPGCWVGCATTLAVMVLTVTWDFRRGRESATW
jgi:hypothetical protein